MSWKEITAAVARNNAAVARVLRLLTDGMPPQVIADLATGGPLWEFMIYYGAGQVPMKDLEALLKRRVPVASVTPELALQWDSVWNKTMDVLPEAANFQLTPVMATLWGEFTQFPNGLVEPPWLMEALRVLEQAQRKDTITRLIPVPAGITYAKLHELFDDSREQMYIRDLGVASSILPEVNNQEIPSGWLLLTTNEFHPAWDRLEMKHAPLAQAALFMTLNMRLDAFTGRTHRNERLTVHGYGLDGTDMGGIVMLSNEKEGERNRVLRVAPHAHIRESHRQFCGRVRVVTGIKT